MNIVTRIARRRAQTGHESEYEALVREMFATMRSSSGFLGADPLPPEQAGDAYQVIVMTWGGVMPRLTKLMRPWLNQAAK